MQVSFKWLIVVVVFLKFFPWECKFVSFLVKIVDTTANKFGNKALMIEFDNLWYTRSLSYWWEVNFQSRRCHTWLAMSLRLVCRRYQRLIGPCCFSFGRVLKLRAAPFAMMSSNMCFEACILGKFQFLIVSGSVSSTIAMYSYDIMLLSVHYIDRRHGINTTYF